MTWIWIAVFVLVCTAPMAVYIYLIEVRDTAASVHRGDERNTGGTP
jgi:hypothetical protein